MGTTLAAYPNLFQDNFSKYTDGYDQKRYDVLDDFLTNGHQDVEAFANDKGLAPFSLWDDLSNFRSYQKADEKKTKTDNFNYHSKNSNIPKLQQYLRSEQNRVRNLPYASYRGPHAATESPLLQHAQNLQATKYGKGNSQIEKRLGDMDTRTKGTYEGLTGNTRDIIDQFLKERDTQHRDSVLGRFNKSFRTEPGLDHYAPKIDEKYATDFAKTEPTFKENLNTYAKKLGAKNQYSDTQSMQTLAALAGKEHRDQELHLDSLENAANADTGIRNMSIEAAKRNFQTQQNEPRNQLNRLEKELRPHFTSEEQKQQDNAMAREHAVRRKAGLEAENSVDIGPYVSKYSSSNEPGVNLESAVKGYGIDNIGQLNNRNVRNTPNMTVANKPASLQQSEKDYMNSELGHSDNFLAQLDKLLEGEDPRSARIAKRAIQDNMASFDRDDSEHADRLTREIQGLGNQYGSSSGNHTNYAYDLAATRAAQQAERRRSVLMKHLGHSGQFEEYGDKTRQLAAHVAAMRDSLDNARNMSAMHREHKRGLGEFDSAQQAEQQQYVDNLTRHNYGWNATSPLEGYNVNPLVRNNAGYERVR